MLHDIWRSGFVRRWHSNPDMAHTAQTNAQHQWGCAVLAHRLFPVDYELLVAALLHDVGEDGVGDISGPAKSRHSDLKAASENAEADRFSSLGIDVPIKTLQLTLVDRIEGYLWARHHMPSLMSRDGWPEMLNGIYALADHLNVGPEVTELMDAANDR